MLPAEREIYETEFVPESSAGGCKLLVSQSRAPTCCTQHKNPKTQTGTRWAAAAPLAHSSLPLHPAWVFPSLCASLGTPAGLKTLQASTFDDPKEPQVRYFSPCIQCSAKQGQLLTQELFGLTPWLAVPLVAVALPTELLAGRNNPPSGPKNWSQESIPGSTRGGNKLDSTCACTAPPRPRPALTDIEANSTSWILVVPESTLGFVLNERTIVVELQKLLTLSTSEKASEIQGFD